MKAAVYDIVRDYGDVRKAEGLAEGEAKGEAKTRKEIAIKCIKMGFSDVVTSDLASLPMEEVQRLHSLVPSV